MAHTSKDWCTFCGCFPELSICKTCRGCATDIMKRLEQLDAQEESNLDVNTETSGHRQTFGSRVFRSMLENKFFPRKGLRRRIPDLVHNELKGVVEFIYSGQLKPETLEVHSKSLIVVADKYDVPQLRDMYEAHLVETLNRENVSGILELSAKLSSPAVLENAALDVILKNWKAISSSNEYAEFALKNPLLALKILRSYSIRKGF